MNQGLTRLCVPLFLILLRSSWAYLQTPETPKNDTVCLGSVSNISCASTNAQTIFYLVNGTAVPSSILQGFSVSAPIFNGNKTQVMLTVPAIYIGVSQIQCSILLINETLPNSFFSYFTVQGPPSAPSTLTAVATGTALNISWEVPPGAQISSLMYTVVVRTGNGTILFNRTVEELQVIINITNVCDQYEAKVMANCGATSGYHSILNFSAGACNSSSTVLPNATMTSAKPISPEVIVVIIAGGVFIIIIIIIIAIVVIVVCCRQGKKSNDTVDHPMNEPMIEMKPNDTVDHPMNEPMIEMKPTVSRLEKEYKDISFIGSGKNGVVIKGIYRADGREYAIKVCKKNSDDNEIKALTDNILKESNHCVRYYDTWADYPEPDWEKRNLLPWTAFKYNPLCPQVDKNHEYRFIKTEYCAGGNLCIWLQNNQQDVNVYYIFNQILDAVAYIHNKNFYHGDLVLQNIFVANGGSNPQLKIGDFTDAVFCEAGMNYENVRRRDVFRLGGILMQLIYFEKTHEILPITDIKKLFTLMPNEAVRKVIELLCGKDASGDNGNTYLDGFKRSDEYVNWRKLDHMQQEYI